VDLPVASLDGDDVATELGGADAPGAAARLHCAVLISMASAGAMPGGFDVGVMGRARGGRARGRKAEETHDGVAMRGDAAVVAGVVGEGEGGRGAAGRMAVWRREQGADGPCHNPGGATHGRGCATFRPDRD
jgi:hypothetical protein